jgi:hypothetical protein
MATTTSGDPCSDPALAEPTAESENWLRTVPVRRLLADDPRPAGVLDGGDDSTSSRMLVHQDDERTS